VILMYHRVAAPAVDPWDLAVAPERFAAQLDVLRQSRRVLALRELVNRAKQGRLPDDAVGITFDDGYADTWRNARPRLAAVGLPATLFLATAFVGRPVEYWWDELTRAMLGPESASWRFSTPPRTAQEAVFHSTWQRLRALPAPARDEAMARIREERSLPPPAADDLPMRADEVASLVRDGLFEVGGHTATHPSLPEITAEERRREILDGRRACEQLTGRAPVGFAYPYGANDAESRSAVEACGFEWACTTQARPVSAAETDWFALPRVAVANWDATAFEGLLWRASA
jgi:peptidoglycan/xylan/chitin deacetylase (PgdA/CDA1 family)